MDGENIRLVWRLAAGLLLATAGDGIGAVDFEAQVRPVFAEHCYGCHGEEKRKGNLRLDTVEGIRRGGNSGEPLFVAGDAERSHLFKLVSGVDPEERMPPEGKGLLGGDELGLIGQWIDEGAVLPGGDLEVELTTDHWSFQPVVRGQVPAGGGGWGVGAVDAFVGRALSERGLTASVRAGRRMLVRRLYLVMHGLPPTREEAEEFVADVEPGAWGRLVDRVLASPRFGERWARHWLDIVRFAETNGFETNRERLTAYRFRDYIIESFNADKPYDQLVREHLAGDATGADVGTGFLVAGAYDIVKSPDVNLTLMQRQDELADMVNTTGTAFLGLTLGCARCHNHKFDPILQKDFYAMQAVFAGVRHGERAIAEDGSAVDGSAVDGKRPAVSARGNTEEFPVTGAKYVRLTISRTNSGGEPCVDELKVFDVGGENVALASSGSVASSSGDLAGYAIHRLGHLNDGRVGNPHSWISDTKGAGWVQIEFPRRHEIERIEWARDAEGKFGDRLAVEYVIEGSLDGERWEVLAGSGDREAFDGEGRAKAWVGTFAQPGPTHRLYRGEPLAKREVVAPDGLAVMGTLGMAVDEVEQRRRVRLAEWIASGENPLTARVMVNRLWQFTFGVGLVDTPSDFGGNGMLPTHPELLDWLASEFVESGWSMKHVLRLLLMSETFRQASFPRPAAEAVDAGSRYLWRFPGRRLEAEAIRDSVLSVAGTLDLRMGGPGFYLLDVDRENVVHYHPKEETGPAEWRRMVYLFKVRQEQDAVFGSFDCPDGNQVIPERSRSTTPLQALNLFNSRFMMQQAEMLAGRLEREAGGGIEAQVGYAFELIYSRVASAEELADAVGFVEGHTLVDFCRAIFNSNEFLFVF